MRSQVDIDDPVVLEAEHDRVPVEYNSSRCTRADPGTAAIEKLLRQCVSFEDERANAYDDRR